MSRWPASAQYGIRAGIALVVLLPIFFVTGRLGGGSLTTTDAATPPTSAPATSTTVALAPLQLPSGTATLPPVPTVPSGFDLLSAGARPEEDPSASSDPAASPDPLASVPAAPEGPSATTPAPGPSLTAPRAGVAPTTPRSGASPTTPGTSPTSVRSGASPTTPGTAPASTQPPTSPTTAVLGPGPTVPAGKGTNGIFEAIRNTQSKFSTQANVPSAQLDVGKLTVAAGRRDNGSVGEGQFRVACEYSHFNYDDPIVFPGQPGRAHLHMYFGNTLADAYSTTESLMGSGGGTCNGFELNRSAYWIPALLDGQGNALAPSSIIIYYKTKAPGTAAKIPTGLRLVAGNTKAETFTTSNQLHWSCGGNGSAYNKTNRIPDCKGDTINATIAFPNCWDGRNLSSPDHSSHTAYVDEGSTCPASHPVRIPQITYLIYWPGAPSVAGWHLSSDRTGGFNTGPGATLHADWWAAWNEKVVELWHNGCIRPARNCSFGQTGTDRQLAPLNGLQKYEGPTKLPLPPGTGPGRN